MSMPFTLTKPTPVRLVMLNYAPPAGASSNGGSSEASLRKCRDSTPLARGVGRRRRRCAGLLPQAAPRARRVGPAQCDPR